MDPLAHLAVAGAVIGAELTFDLDGGSATYLVNTVPLSDPGGRLTGSVSVFHDVSGARRLEREAIDHAVQLRTLVDLVSEGVFIVGTDGGFYVSYDRGARWDHQNHAGALGQFYHVAVDNRTPYRVYGGLQDNGSWGGPSRSDRFPGPINPDWVNVSWGDGFVCRVDTTDHDIVYYESQDGAMFRRNLRTNEAFLREREKTAAAGTGDPRRAAVQDAALERAHHEDADAEVVGQRQQLALGVAAQGVVGDLHHVQAAAPHQARQVREGRLLVMGGAHRPHLARGLETLQEAQLGGHVDQVVDLVDVDGPVQPQRVLGLGPARLWIGGPDLGGHQHPVADAGQGLPQGLLGAAVHGRGVEKVDAGGEGRLHQGAAALGGVEGAPGAHPDGGHADAGTAEVGSLHL